MTTSLVQIKFDKQYISAAEITKELGISRAGFLHGRRTGKLPDPIMASDGRLFMWERTEGLMEKIAVWKKAINARKAA